MLYLNGNGTLYQCVHLMWTAEASIVISRWTKKRRHELLIYMITLLKINTKLEYHEGTVIFLSDKQTAATEKMKTKISKIVECCFYITLDPCSVFLLQGSDVLCHSTLMLKEQTDCLHRLVSDWGIKCLLCLELNYCSAEAFETRSGLLSRQANQKVFAPK